MLNMNDINEASRRVNSEGISQYILSVDAEDVLFSLDAVVIQMVSDANIDLNILDRNIITYEILEVLKKELNPHLCKVVVEDGKIHVKPLVECNIEMFNLMVIAKKSSNNFVLRDIYNKYLRPLKSHIAFVMHEIYLNKNISSLLVPESNHIFYDDTNDLSYRILKELVKTEHLNRVIPRKDREKFIIKEINSMKTYVDFVTNDLKSIIDMADNFTRLVGTGEITDKGATQMITSCIVGSNSVANIDMFNKMEKRTFSIGLGNLFEIKM